jgi:hypothetical protein
MLGKEIGSEPNDSFCSHAPMARIPGYGPQTRELQLDDLRGVNVFAGANFPEQLCVRGGVEI